MNRILIIEDEEMIRKQLTKLLERNNYAVSGVATIEDAIAGDPDSHDLILADIRLPGAPGTDILHQVRHAPVIIMTSHASVRSAVDSMKLGAVDYISKPFDHEELLHVIERSLRENRLSAQNAAMREDLRRLLPENEFTSNDDSMQVVRNALTRLPASANCVYLWGERGSGKELLARLAHDTSLQSNGPLIIADLPLYEPAAMETMLFGPRNESADVITDKQDKTVETIETAQPEDASSAGSNSSVAFSYETSMKGGKDQTGANSTSAPGHVDNKRQLNLQPHNPFGLLRAAQSGTLVLRSLFELPISTQERLCEWLDANGRGGMRGSQRTGASLRLVALNDRDLKEAEANGELSPQFAQRFSGLEFRVPPLRERSGDIALLAQQFMQQFLRRYRKRSITLSPDALFALQAYHWPGNVNELRSVIERAVLSVEANRIEPAHLGISQSVDEGSSIPLDLTLDGYFRYFVMNHQQYLSETELAGKLGISRKALWERRQKMNIPRS